MTFFCITSYIYSAWILYIDPRRRKENFQEHLMDLAKKVDGKIQGANQNDRKVYIWAKYQLGESLRRHDHDEAHAYLVFLILVLFVEVYGIPRQ